MTQKFVKEFAFDASARSRIDLVGEARLDSPTQRVQLRRGLRGYPSGQAHSFRTWVTNPRACHEWVMVEVDGFEPPGTALKYRLSDGADDFFWDGTSWAIASASGDWSSEAEVSANISAFLAGPIQFVVNLETTDREKTPSVRAIRVLYDGVLFGQEDLLIRTFLRAMRGGVRGVGELAVQLSQAGSVVSLAEIETPYKIVGVDSVFNETLDPDARHDIAGVYDGGAQTVGLTEAGSAGDLIRVRFVYAPPIVFTTSQNYVEMAAVPAITVTGSAGTRKTHTRGASVIDRATGKGWQLSPAVQIDFDLSIKFVTDKLRDHMRLAGAVRQFVDDNPLIRLSGLDEDTPLRIISDYDQDAGAQSGLHSGRIRVRLDRAVIVSGDATEVVSVRRMDLALSGDE